MNFSFGPMSQNVVDTILEFSKTYNKKITFIPSRRQIEYNGGYVNGWTTKNFYHYIKSSSDLITVQRDHGGPEQGSMMDDGIQSFETDVKFMDGIHIDPWKAFPRLEDGINETIRLIRFCHSNNPTLYYEIGTEEAICPYSVDELYIILFELKKQLEPEIFSQIRFAVIQCGTKLSEGTNIGEFNADKLREMLRVVREFGLIAKEHNGDWQRTETHMLKKNIGLTEVNIAPELASIESGVIYSAFNENDRETFFQLCYESDKWRKWVPTDFDFLHNQEKILFLAGHYVFSHPKFIQLKEKEQYRGLDGQIKEKITERLIELHQS
jgi:hypothetical protein